MHQILIHTNFHQASIFVLSFPLCSIFVLHIFIFSFPLYSRPKEYAQWSNGAWSGNTDHLYRKKRGKTSNKGMEIVSCGPFVVPPPCLKAGAGWIWRGFVVCSPVGSHKTSPTPGVGEVSHKRPNLSLCPESHRENN